MFVFRDFERIFEFILDVICMENKRVVGNLNTKIRIEILVEFWKEILVDLMVLTPPGFASKSHYISLLY